MSEDIHYLFRFLITNYRLLITNFYTRSHNDKRIR